jgi:hypothetical protein
MKSANVLFEALIADSEWPRIQEVALDFEKQGAKVTGCLKSIGMITGSVPARLKSRLSKIRGVKDLREPGKFHAA